MPESEWRDPIVEEVRRVRGEHAARFNYDVKAIAEDLRNRQAESGHNVVLYSPRPALDADSSSPHEGVA